MKQFTTVFWRIAKIAALIIGVSTQLHAGAAYSAIFKNETQTPIVIDFTPNADPNGSEDGFYIEAYDLGSGKRKWPGRPLAFILKQNEQTKVTMGTDVFFIPFMGDDKEYYMKITDYNTGKLILKGVVHLSYENLLTITPHPVFYKDHPAWEMGPCWFDVNNYWRFDNLKSESEAIQKQYQETLIDNARNTMELFDREKINYMEVMAPEYGKQGERSSGQTITFRHYPPETYKPGLAQINIKFPKSWYTDHKGGGAF